MFVPQPLVCYFCRRNYGCDIRRKLGKKALEVSISNLVHLTYKRGGAESHNAITRFGYSLPDHPAEREVFETGINKQNAFLLLVILSKFSVFNFSVSTCVG